MAVTYQTKEQIEDEMLEQEIELHCTRATCMAAIKYTKKEYKRLLEESTVLKCPACGWKMI